MHRVPVRSTWAWLFRSNLCDNGKNLPKLVFTKNVFAVEAWCCIFCIAHWWTRTWLIKLQLGNVPRKLVVYCTDIIVPCNKNDVKIKSTCINRHKMFSLMLSGWYSEKFVLLCWSYATQDYKGKIIKWAFIWVSNFYTNILIFFVQKRKKRTVFTLQHLHQSMVALPVLAKSAVRRRCGSVLKQPVLSYLVMPHVQT